MASTYTKRKQILSAELGKIYDRDGILTPHAVLAEAADESSPLHQYFQWDDAKAAYEHRLEQARSLIRSVKVDTGGAEEVRVPAFVHVGDEGGYMPVSQVVKVESAMNSALRELRGQLRGVSNTIAALYAAAEGDATKRRIEFLAKHVVEATAGVDELTTEHET